MKRVVFYLFFDPQGVVDDYVTHKLRALRPFTEHIFVVSNSPLTAESQAKLDEVADTVWVRQNVGFDVWAYKEAMEQFGQDRLADYDELILMNYTFFAPIFPFAETFERMEAADVDFWGLTAHAAVPDNPFEGRDGELPMHIQSHWIAVRRSMFQSHEFIAYWRDMPMITSYDDSIMEHEAKFTKHFADLGFRYVVAFALEDFPSDHPIFDSAELMVEQRCPILKRRPFFHEPSYLDRNAIVLRRVMDKVEEAGHFPTSLIWANLARSTEPRNTYTNASMLEVVPEFDDGWRPQTPPRLVVLAHIYYEDMVDEIMGHLASIPIPYDLVVTTTTAEKKAVIEAALAAYDIAGVEVRLVENRGRDMSALLVGCRDVLTSGRYDLALRVHSKKSPQDDHNAATLFKHHMFDNLLLSTGYVAHILRMFDKEPTLGMVFPPVVNIGYPTLGHSWFTNRPLAEKVAKMLGLHVVFDRSTPLAPYGSMFWFRPEAMLKMTGHEWTWEDYPLEAKDYGDGSITHVQERLMAYTALDSGHHVRCVINREWAAINYTFLEYKLQRVAAMLPHFTQDQVDYLSRLQTEGPALLHLKRAVDERYPGWGQRLRPAYRAARGGARVARAVTSRLRGGSA